MLKVNPLTPTQGATHAPTQESGIRSSRYGGDRVCSRRSRGGGRLPWFWPRPVDTGTRVVRRARGGHAAARHPLLGRVGGRTCRTSARSRLWRLRGGGARRGWLGRRLWRVRLRAAATGLLWAARRLLSAGSGLLSGGAPVLCTSPVLRAASLLCAARGLQRRLRRRPRCVSRRPLGVFPSIGRHDAKGC